MINPLGGLSAQPFRPDRHSSSKGQAAQDSQKSGANPALGRFLNRLRLDDTVAPRQQGPISEQTAQSASDPAISKQGTSADERTRDYIYFLAGLGGDGCNPGEFAKRVDELNRQCADPINSNQTDDQGGQSDWTVESFSLGFSSSNKVSLDVAATQDGFSLSASAESHFSASFQGEFVTADGRHLSISATVQVDIQLQLDIQARQSDPLALDLDGDGEVTFTDLEQGGFVPEQMFDLNADGLLDQVGFVGGKDGVLAFDRNGNGTIDNGSELFGDQNGASNGFLELAKFDQDSNGVIDSADSIFNALKIFRQTKDGFETKPLADYSVDQISLDYQAVQMQIQNGGTITQIGAYSAHGERRTVYDLLLPYRTADNKADATA